MSKNQRRRGVVLGYINIIVKNLVNLLYTPMLLAFVGQGDYGVFQTSNSFIFSLAILSLGFTGAYVRFYTQKQAATDEEGIRILNGMYLLLYLVVCAVVIMVGLLFSANVGLVFSGGFTADEVNLAGILMSIMTFNVAVVLFSSVFDANIIVHEEFTFQQTRQLLTTLAIPGLALVLLFAGFETVGVACAQLIVNVVLLILNATFTIRHLNMRFEFLKFDGVLFRAVAAFSGWLFINQLCNLINQNVPNVILGAECGAVIVAVFAVSIQIRNVFISLSTALSNVFIPQVNRIVAESDDNTLLTQIMTRVGRYQMLLLGWVYGGFVILGQFFIIKWAGEGFINAYWMLLAMIAPILVPLSQNVGIEIQKAKNMHKARSIVYLIMAILSVVLTAITAPYLGYWAAAISYIGSIVLGNCIFMNWYYQKKVGLDMKFYWKAVLPVILCIAISTGICLFGTYWIPVNNWIVFFEWGAIFTVIFAITVYAIVLDHNERVKLKDKIVSKLQRTEFK